MFHNIWFLEQSTFPPILGQKNIEYLENVSHLSSMEDEALEQFKKDIAALTNVSGMSKRQKTENGRLFILGQSVSASPSLQTESEHKASLCSDYESYIRAQKTAWEPRSECI